MSMDVYTLRMPFRSTEEPEDGSVPDGVSRPNRNVPSLLDLIRLSPEPVLPPGGEALYRQIALFTELEAGREVLDAACGRGLTTAFLAANHGIHGIGLDTDPALVEEASQRARAMGLSDRLSYESAALDDRPFQDGVFDVSIGEIGLGASANPASVVQELARVTKPLGMVVLVQLVWSGNVDEERRELLVEHLGARPLMLVEWKQCLRDAGCVDLHVEDWSEAASPFRPAATGPFALPGIFSFRQKLVILRRAIARWGWRGVRGALSREEEIHNLLASQRVLGLSLIVGTKWHADGG